MPDFSHCNCNFCKKKNKGGDTVTRMNLYGKAIRVYVFDCIYCGHWNNNPIKDCE